MCRCFTQHYTWQEIHGPFELTAWKPPGEIRPRYKISPAAMIDTVRLVSGQRVFGPMRWGLIPDWWQLAEEPTNPAAFNAGLDRVATVPFFRSSFSRKHCLIPASGFYAWQDTAAGRQPYYFARGNGCAMAIAGLWDEWRNPDTQQLTRSCTMLTGKPNQMVAEVSGRMPVVLEPAQFESWLSGEVSPELYEPFSESMLNKRPVSKRLNGSRASEADETLIEKITLPDRDFSFGAAERDSREMERLKPQ
jgi:putative SOS response-associated peptidase YedK